jgi:phage terminase large subunit
MMRNKYPGTTGFFWRKELKRLKITTLASYFKFCDDYKIPERQRWVYNAQDSIINFANGSKILLLDLAHQPSDPLYTRFGSLELTDWFIDESNEIEEQCITIISTRIGRQKNEEYDLLPKLLQTFNPDKWHVYRKFYKAYTTKTLEPYRCFIPALATDNKKIPQAYIDQLMKADEVTKQRLLYGNFEYDDTPGRLFNYDAIFNMWDNPAINGEKYLSIDAARKGKDKTVIFEWDWLEVVAIKKEDISQLKDLSDEIRKKYQWKIQAKNIIVDENWVWWWLIDNLRCQWFINNAKPLQPKKSNLSNVRFYEHLKTQCYFKLAEYVNLWKIRISVQDADIKSKLIEELDIIVEIALDQDSKIKIIKKEDIISKLWRSPDYSDAMMMRMFYEIDKRPTIEEEEENKNNNDDPLWIFEEDEIDEFELDLEPY